MNKIGYCAVVWELECKFNTVAIVTRIFQSASQKWLRQVLKIGAVVFGSYIELLGLFK